MNLPIQGTFESRRKLNIAILVCVSLFIVANVLLDFSQTLCRNSSFYLSESLLFSSHWLLFLPLLAILLQTPKWTFAVLAVAVHLLVYPALVWTVSALFYEHTFDYWQTFNYGLSAYFIQKVLIYSFTFAASAWHFKKPIEKKKSHIASILIADRGKKIPLPIAEVLYFSADPPYIGVHVGSKKYLHNQTLKSLENQLDDNQFVRIHKSHLVNIHQIASIQSRQNGDYDVTLSNQTVLRLSRNYAKNFKAVFSAHHLAAK